MFADAIVSVKSRSECIERINQDNDIPTVLYGAGIYAIEVEKFLRSFSVNVVGCFVDDAYLPGPQINGLEVSSFKKIRETYDKFKLVIAFCGDPVLLKKKVADLKCDQIASVQFFDCRFWERFAELTLPYIQIHISQFQQIYDWLEDDLSKTIFVKYINTKLTFDSSYLSGLCSGYQYFPKDLPAFIPNGYDVFIDGGAYTGDTLASLVAQTNGSGCKKYFAFEPDPENFNRLSNFVKEKDLGFVFVLNKGLWSHRDILHFQSTCHSASLVTYSGNINIEVDCIDNLNEAATFIKMDIEGSELEALKGASKTIQRSKPKLAIALYHRPTDLLNIPTLIKTLCPEYSFHLRIHSPMSEELVLYAVVKTSEDGEK